MVTAFRETVNDCNLIDLGCRGYPFTWSNRRFGPQLIEERLDRFFGSKDWDQNPYNLIVSNLDTWCSDHSPVMLKMQERNKFAWYKKNSSSRVFYEDMWSHYEACKNIVKKEWLNGGSWSQGDPVTIFKKTTSNCLAQLRIWSRKKFNGQKEKLKHLKKKLSEMKHNFTQWEEVNEIKSTEEQIEKILLDEEVYWKQRSRADWLKEGDKNTKYFHSKASSRKRKNRIWGVMDQHDVWIDDREGVEKQFCEYFASLFTTSSP